MFKSDLSLVEKIQLRNKYTKKIIQKLTKSTKLLIDFDKNINNHKLQRGGVPGDTAEGEGAGETVSTMISKLSAAVSEVDSNNAKLIALALELAIEMKYDKNLKFTEQQKEVDKATLEELQKLLTAIEKSGNVSNLKELLDEIMPPFERNTRAARKAEEAKAKKAKEEAEEAEEAKAKKEAEAKGSLDQSEPAGQSKYLTRRKTRYQTPWN